MAEFETNVKIDLPLKKFFLFIAVFFLFKSFSFAQIDSAESRLRFLDIPPEYNSCRMKIMMGTTVGLWGGIMGYLGTSWYNNFSSFHFFDDGGEWLQMDKIGHGWTTYQISRNAYTVFRWTGLDDKHSVWYAGLMGFSIVSSVEILDGFSPDWGASISDLTANFLGSSLCVSQGLLWKEQRIQPKLSFHRTSFAKQRPDLLGNGLQEEFFKDYNGQTYWLSFRVNSFLRDGRFEDRYPDWLNLAFGYGGEGMIGGYRQDPKEVVGAREYRQYYLSLDIDFTQFKVKSNFLKIAFGVLNMVHLPMPAVQWDNRNKFTVYGFYF